MTEYDTILGQVSGH